MRWVIKCHNWGWVLQCQPIAVKGVRVRAPASLVRWRTPRPDKLRIHTAIGLARAHDNLINQISVGPGAASAVPSHRDDRVIFFSLLAPVPTTPAYPPRIEAVWATAPRLGPPSPRTDSGAKIVPGVRTCRDRDFRWLLCFALSYCCSSLLRSDYIIFPFLFLLFSYVSSICWHPDLIPRILGPCVLSQIIRHRCNTQQ